MNDQAPVRSRTPPLPCLGEGVGGEGRRGSAWAEAGRHWHFYLFISPFFILFAVFGLYPLLFSLYLSFVKWDGLSPQVWVGLGNFQAMLDDDILRKSLWNTLVIGLLYVPPMLILAFFFAHLLNQQWLKLRAFYRAAFFLPCVTPMVVIAIVFGLFFSSEKGLLNYLITSVGSALPFLHLKPVAWTNSEQWSKVAIAILVAWRWTGYNMVLMLAGLQGISEEYYEAASIDGATPWQRVRHVTLPLMTPTFRFCGILSLLGTIYMFDEIFILTGGGPGTSSTNFGLYLFNLSFNDFRFGYASCVAYTVAFFVFLGAIALQRMNRRAEAAA
jgi:ABC-type sugar transport system permease subunit